MAKARKLLIAKYHSVKRNKPLQPTDLKPPSPKKPRKRKEDST